ncbi:MAG: N-acetylglucosamine-6-phosphate deacetylase [Paracoccaceae bacterium]
MTHSNDHWLSPTQLFDGQTLSSDSAVQMSDGRVVSVALKYEIPANATVHNIDGTLSPGFFDIQINGGGNVLFNSQTNSAGLARIAAAHHAHGTTHWLPTVITDGPDVMAAACTAVLENHGQHGIAGIHIEGPHIAIERKGTHKSHWIRPLDDNTLTQVKRMRSAGVPVLITVAPEAMRPGEIAQLVSLGSVVSLGHSNASSAQTQAALAEGAQLFTHLFNAMSQIESREQNVVGTAINSDRYCSIIVDGLHVDLGVVGMAVRARPVGDRMIIVSDAMPTVGGSPEFELYGNFIKLVDGRLINQEGSLAGAHITQFEELCNMVQKIGIPLETALRMVTQNPARLMGVSDSLGTISAGHPADMIVIASDFSDIASVITPAVQGLVHQG